MSFGIKNMSVNGTPATQGIKTAYPWIKNIQKGQEAIGDTADNLLPTLNKTTLSTSTSPGICLGLNRHTTVGGEGDIRR